jgi:hypothetical protein
MLALPKVLFRCSAATLQRCNLVLQRCNIVVSQMMPPISAHATRLCKSGPPFDETQKYFVKIFFRPETSTHLRHKCCLIGATPFWCDTKFNWCQHHLSWCQHHNRTPRSPQIF